jgi:demethylmenaquinone methyltransferase/2-methoxy-6-polyprenyl-1,4-benzoquinol methylase
MDLNRFFTKVASQYDKLAATLTLGLDKSLLREAVKESNLGKKHAKVLDVATGTGRVAMAIAKSYPGYNVIGIDLNSDMLSNAIKKSRNIKNVDYLIGDVESLSFESSYFDIVASAFSLGIFSDLEKAIKEMHRVLKPKGKIILIDMLKPKDSVLNKLVDLYYSINVIPALDARLKKDVLAYVRSLKVDKDYVIEELKRAGFRSINEKDFAGGLAFVITAIK